MLYALLLLLADAEPVKDEGGAPSWFSFVPLLGIVVFFYILVVLPMQRDKKQREKLTGALKKNDEVVTSAGIIGIVTNIKEAGDEVTLKIDDNARIRVLKSTIVRVIPREGNKEAT